MSLLERAAAAAREIVERRTASMPLAPETDRLLVTIMVTEAFTVGALWGLERAQHAVALTHAKYRTELEEQ